MNVFIISRKNWKTWSSHVIKIKYYAFPSRNSPTNNSTKYKVKWLIHAIFERHDEENRELRNRLWWKFFDLNSFNASSSFWPLWQSLDVSKSKHSSMSSYQTKYWFEGKMHILHFSLSKYLTKKLFQKKVWCLEYEKLLSQYQGWQNVFLSIVLLATISMICNLALCSSWLPVVCTEIISQ